MEFVKYTRSYLCVWVLLTAGFLFNSCAVQQVREPKIKDGQLYGVVQGTFRHRWWNYFERGLSFAEGGFVDDAIADLMAAIQQRFKDQRMARTYGFHFIDYFPHRELGINYLLKGFLDKAEAELTLSLSHFPSAKAYYYLDRVREELIKLRGGEVPAPRLTLDTDDHVIWTRDDPIKITGRVTDDAYVSAVSVMGVPIFMEGSHKQVNIDQALNLSQGKHNIEVLAVNLMGKSAHQKLTIHVDRQGPMITIEDLKKTDGSPTLTVSGSVYDPLTTVFLQINGEAVSLKVGSEAFFFYQLPENTQTIELIARDKLGNQTTAQLNVAQTLTAKRPVMLVDASASSLDMLAASFFGNKDTIPPDIRLKGWTDSQTVYLDKIYLEGEVTDNNRIAGLEINQKPILRREGKSIFFNHLAELDAGKNNLQVKAVDGAGNVAEKNISITKETPKALQLTERMRTTIMPFEQKGMVSNISLSFQDNLTNALFAQNRFQIIERQKLDYVLQEQKLSQTDLIEKRTAIRLGKLVASQSIITGSIIDTHAGLEIVARMIDTETSELLASEDVFGEEKSFLALKSLSEGMAIKFHQEFPLVDGLVVQKKGKHIFTDIGEPKTKLSRRLIVYREEAIKHPVSGKVLGTDNAIIGRVRVTQVMPDLSKAEVVTGNVDEMKPLDKVITE